MSNQIEDDEIAQFVTKAAKRNRMEIRYAWAKISAGEQTEPTTPETTPEQGEEIRDAWAKISAGE